MEGPFIIRNENIYHLPSNNIIIRPSVLYDTETYTVLKIGDYSLCNDYFHLLMSRGFLPIDKIALLEFDTDINKACENMNNIINCTGYIEHMLKEQGGLKNETS